MARRHFWIDSSAIDGVDLRDMELGDLARIVGVVSQETHLLHGTIRENLRHAKPTPPTPR